MTPQAAKALLDRVRDGDIYSAFVINKALYMTGDLSDIELEQQHGIHSGICSVWGASPQGQAKVFSQGKPHTHLHTRKDQVVGG